MVENSVTCEKYRLVNNIVYHIFRESGKAFQGTIHEDIWKFHHDELALFFVTDGYKYMQEKGCHPHLILLRVEAVRKRRMQGKC